MPRNFGPMLTLTPPPEVDAVERLHEDALQSLKDAAHEIESAIMLQVEKLVRDATGNILQQLAEMRASDTAQTFVRNRLSILLEELEAL